MTVTVTDISLPDVEGGSVGLTGVLAVPDGPGPWPGVVLVHEAYGVTEVMRRQVIRLAEAGYLALMPDLFSQGGPRRCLIATFRALRSGEGRAFVDIENARTFLAAPGLHGGDRRARILHGRRVRAGRGVRARIRCGIRQLRDAAARPR